MAYTTPNMGLKAWDQDTDPYSHDDLKDNWIAVDQHDHSEGKGAPLSLDSFPVLGQGNLGPCSVGTTQICDGAVVQAKLAVPSVGTGNVYPSAITSDKIASGAVGTAALADHSVSTVKLADLSVTTPKLVDASVINSKIADGSVSNGKIGTGAVTTPKIADSSVSTSKIQNLAVTGVQLANQTITQNKLADDSVLAQAIGALPGCFLSLTQPQSIAHNDFHRVLWDNVRWDNDPRASATLFDGTHEIVIRTEGIYLIEACVLYEDGNQGAGVSGRMAKIRRNNVPFSGCGPVSPLPDAVGGPFRVRLPMVSIAYCVPGDAIDVVTQQTSGHDQNVIPEGASTHLGVVFLSGPPI